MNIKLTYISFCICVLLLLPVRIAAQVCNPNFTVNTEITNSTCQSNGEIRVTLSGDNIADLINVQYGLTSTTPGGFSIEPRTDPVLKNIPPGTYDLTVRAFCKNDSDYDVVKKAMGLVVGGNYTVPVATFNASTSRKSYDTCGTGKIALNVTGGNGTFTFTITSAPAGATLGTVVPIRSGTVYTFPTENYPAGDYSVQVSDACYSAACNFTLEGISGFPAVRSSSSYFYPTLVDNDCSQVSWNPGSVSSSTADYYRYYLDGMYEVGLAPAGETPTTWVVWNSSTRRNMDISPYKYRDLHGTSGKLYAHLRVKGCPDLYTSVAASFSKPLFSTGYTRYCDYYSYTTSPRTDNYGLLCYPLSLLVETSDSIVLSNNDMSYPASQNVQLQYGTAYKISFTDADGYVLSTNLTPSRGIFTFSYTEDVCNNQFRVTYSTTERCYPIDVTIKDLDGDTIHTNTLTSAANGSCYLVYGVNYTFSAVYRDTNPLYTYTTKINKTSSIPTAYTLTQPYSNACSEDSGYLRISSSNSSIYPVANTTYTVTGPAGYTTQTGTLSTSLSYTSLSITYLPPGLYTVTIVNGCGSQTPITATYNHPGVYSGKNLDYTTETTCSGMKVTPTGYITYQRVERPSGTFYRLTNGPTGYDKTVKKPGESFTFSTPGKYVLGIITTNSPSQCAIATDTIEYTAPPLALDPHTTSAYVCVGGSVGNISINAINGLAPYTYELWDEANTTKLAADVTTSGTAYFPYGSVNETYTVRITDGCGNSFNQQITVADMKTARIVYSAEPEVCNGDTISLNCITLGTTAYSWTGPNGFASTEQNPIIANAQENMSGWYRVSVTPEYCGMAVEDSVLITVYPPLTAGVSVGNQTTCVRTTPSVLSSETTGGKGAYAYQWQSSADGVSWADIPNATQATYQPPVQSYAGLFYYRRTSADDCHTVYSTPVKVKVKACYIPVNPHIRHMK